jgi:hypothetical protein
MSEAQNYVPRSKILTAQDVAIKIKALADRKGWTIADTEQYLFRYAFGRLDTLAANEAKKGPKPPREPKAAKPPKTPKVKAEKAPSEKKARAEQRKQDKANAVLEKVYETMLADLSKIDLLSEKDKQEDLCKKEGTATSTRLRAVTFEIEKREKRDAPKPAPVVPIKKKDDNDVNSSSCLGRATKLLESAQNEKDLDDVRASCVKNCTDQKEIDAVDVVYYRCLDAIRAKPKAEPKVKAEKAPKSAPSQRPSPR